MANNGAQLFEDRFVAFLDILGFADYITDPSFDQSEKISRFYQLQANLSNLQSETAATDIKVEMSTFSDSVILSIISKSDDMDEPEALQHLIWAARIGDFLLEAPFFFGPMHHRQQIVLGKALVDAYRYEHKVARYPRVAVVGKARFCAERLEDANAWLRYSRDGPMFVHFLADLEDFAASIPKIGWKAAIERPAFRSVVRITDLLKDKLEDSRDNPRHFENNKWFAIYFNEYVLQRNSLEFEGWPPPILIG
jgi:hypothetical protein